MFVTLRHTWADRLEVSLPFGAGLGWEPGQRGGARRAGEDPARVQTMCVVLVAVHRSSFDL